jgi:hypothetical protein
MLSFHGYQNLMTYKMERWSGDLLFSQYVWNHHSIFDIMSCLLRTSSSIPLSPPTIENTPYSVGMSDAQSGKCSEVFSLPEIVVSILDSVDDIKPSSLVSKSFNQAYHSVQKKRGVRLTDFTLTDERLEQHGLSVKVAPEVSFGQIREVRACDCIVSPSRTR